MKKPKVYELTDIGEIRPGDIILDPEDQREGECINYGCIAEHVGVELIPTTGLFRHRKSWQLVMWDGKCVRKLIK